MIEWKKWMNFNEWWMRRWINEWMNDLKYSVGRMYGWEILIFDLCILYD